mgnify:CR=1 FL=1
MPTSKLEEYLKNQNTRQFSNQTFSDFRQDLLDYANTFYKDNILDFSEVSLGGMLLDFASIVGDSLIYYAEQQFNELDYSTATDPSNIVKHLKRANIKDSKASPSSVDVTFTIEVPALQGFDENVDQTLLPEIRKGTTISSDTGIIFTLQEDIDFSKDYIIEVGEESLTGIETYFVSKKGLCVSGQIYEETFNIPDNENYFISVELERENITSIISIYDNDNNEYFEVDYLSQSTVFKKKTSGENNYISIIPAPRRFVTEENFLTGRTSIRFGNGNGKTVKDDIFYNPEDLLLPLKNKDTFSRADLDPGKLLKSDTLGISPRGKTITVTYKSGGGTSHNVSRNSIVNIIGEPLMVFPKEALNVNDIDAVIESLFVNNEQGSVGGAQALSLEELKQQIPSVIRSQNRIVSYEDLISRILTMPTDFGRINKAVALNNPYNNFTKDLFIVCKNSEGFYVAASDAIKKNMSNYLNEYRVIGDSFNIVDVPVFNFGIEAQIVVKAGYDPENVIFDVNSRLVERMRFDLLQIGDPIDVNMIDVIIKSTEGVADIITSKENIIVSKNLSQVDFDSELLEIISYNNNTFSPSISYNNGLIFPERGGIFEMKYTFNDINITGSK